MALKGKWNSRSYNACNNHSRSCNGTCGKTCKTFRIRCGSTQHSKQHNNGYSYNIRLRLPVNTLQPVRLLRGPTLQEPVTAATTSTADHAMGHVAKHARLAEPDVAAVTTASSTQTVTATSAD